jgi:hypothetical protein
MSGVRERARILQEETEKIGKSIESQQNGELLSEDDQKALDKVCSATVWMKDLILTMCYSFSKTTTGSSSTSRNGSKTQRRSTPHGRRRSNHGQQSDKPTTIATSVCTIYRRFGDILLAEERALRDTRREGRTASGFNLIVAFPPSSAIDLDKAPHGDRYRMLEMTFHSPRYTTRSRVVRYAFHE